MLESFSPMGCPFEFCFIQSGTTTALRSCCTVTSRFIASLDRISYAFSPIDIMNLAIVGISLLVVRVLADEESVLKPEFGKGLFGPPQLARPLSSRHQAISAILPWF